MNDVQPRLVAAPTASAAPNAASASQINFLRRCHANFRRSRCDHTSTIGEITCPVSSITTTVKNQYNGRSAAVPRNPIHGCQKNHASAASTTPAGIPLQIQHRSQAGLRIHFTVARRCSTLSNKPSSERHPRQDRQPAARFSCRKQTHLCIARWKATNWACSPLQRHLRRR